MKVRLKHVRADTVSVDKGNQRIHIFTNRNTINLSVYTDKEQDAFHEFTFDQLHSLIRNLRPGIENHVP